MVIYGPNKLLGNFEKQKIRNLQIARLIFIKTEKKTGIQSDLKSNYTSVMLNNFFSMMNI